MNKIYKIASSLIAIFILFMIIITLTLYSVSVANADKVVTEKYADSVKYKYALEAEGQRWLANNDKIFEDGNEITIGENEEVHLNIAIQLKDDGKYEIVKWQYEAPEIEYDTIDNLWKGSQNDGN